MPAIDNIIYRHRMHSVVFYYNSVVDRSPTRPLAPSNSSLRASGMGRWMAVLSSWFQSVVVLIKNTRFLLLVCSTMGEGRKMGGGGRGQCRLQPLMILVMTKSLELVVFCLQSLSFGSWKFVNRRCQQLPLNHRHI